MSRSRNKTLVHKNESKKVTRQSGGALRPKKVFCLQIRDFSLLELYKKTRRENLVFFRQNTDCRKNGGLRFLRPRDPGQIVKT